MGFPPIPPQCVVCLVWGNCTSSPLKWHPAHLYLSQLHCFNELLSESENYLIASQWDWCALWKTGHICCWEGCSFRTFLIVLSVEYFIVNGWLKITLKLSLQMSKINNELRDDDHFNSRVSYLLQQCSASLALIVNCQYKNWSFIPLGPKFWQDLMN